MHEAHELNYCLAHLNWRAMQAHNAQECACAAWSMPHSRMMPVGPAAAIPWVCEVWLVGHLMDELRPTPSMLGVETTDHHPHGTV